MEHLVVPTFVLDAKGHVTIWNRACERLTGVRASEVIGTKRHWSGFYEKPRLCLADLVLSGQGDRVDDLYTANRSETYHQGALSAENWCVLPQCGARRYLAIDAGPIYSPNGSLIAVVETLRDITSQKEAQTALETLASQDGLTGVANRRMFDQRLAAEWQHPAQLSLLMIDIDHFKPYNDALGHQRGDDCLKRIASLIVSETRQECDLVARYGGEEFAVILPHADMHVALAVGRRILAAVKCAAIDHPDPACPPLVSLSIGAACRESRSEAPEALIAEADASLYRAKQLGRDRIIMGETDIAA
ncbi:diguanylate cyclase [Aurantimonas sp. A2-1-M11]|uniref:sensor domain-containing diguanylate cyclase n=1 Tax=Aurantimonas sp. A2-1-M11 TaxID=3113712 RepID=UPI002F9486A9